MSIYKTEATERRSLALYAQARSRWPVPHEELTVETRYGQTFVIACGPKDAPPIMLLHGSGTNASSWMPDIPALASRFRVHAVDLIGEPGLSAPVRPSLASDGHALWLDDVMDGLWLARAGFVGASLGGLLAADYAIRRPDRVDRLALLCPAGIGPHRTGFVFLALTLLAFGPWGRRQVWAMVAKGSDAPRAFLDYIQEVSRTVKHRHGKVPVFTDAQIARLTMPVLAVVGGKDILLDSAETRRRLERCAPQAKVRFLPDAGHLLPFQSDLVAGFLSGES